MVRAAEAEPDLESARFGFELESAIEDRDYERVKRVMADAKANRATRNSDDC